MKDQIVSPNHPVYGTVTRVTQNIINSNQDLDLLKRQIWTVVVVDSADENAFVLPVILFWSFLKFFIHKFNWFCHYDTQIKCILVPSFSILLHHDKANSLVLYTSKPLPLYPCHILLIFSHSRQGTFLSILAFWRECSLNLSWPFCSVMN